MFTLLQCFPLRVFTLSNYFFWESRIIFLFILMMITFYSKNIKKYLQKYYLYFFLYGIIYYFIHQNQFYSENQPSNDGTGNKNYLINTVKTCSLSKSVIYLICNHKQIYEIPSLEANYDSVQNRACSMFIDGNKFAIRYKITTRKSIIISRN